MSAMSFGDREAVAAADVEQGLHYFSVTAKSWFSKEILSLVLSLDMVRDVPTELPESTREQMKWQFADGALGRLFAQVRFGKPAVREQVLTWTKKMEGTLYEELRRDEATLETALTHLRQLRHGVRMMQRTYDERS